MSKEHSSMEVNILSSLFLLQGLQMDRILFSLTR